METGVGKWVLGFPRLVHRLETWSWNLGRWLIFFMKNRPKLWLFFNRNPRVFVDQNVKQNVKCTFSLIFLDKSNLVRKHHLGRGQWVIFFCNDMNNTSGIFCELPTIPMKSLLFG